MKTSILWFRLKTLTKTGYSVLRALLFTTCGMAPPVKKPRLVWVGSGQRTGICHLLIHDIAFRPFPQTSVDTLTDILNEEFVDTDLKLKFTEDWYSVVVQVPMTEDINKIVSFIADDIHMSSRRLTANDMNRRYEAEIPAQLAAPGTISGQEKVNGYNPYSSCASS